MVLQLRHRLILVWLITIVLAMSIAAGLFMALLLDFHQANAKARLRGGFGQIQNRINTITEVIRENGNRFAKRQKIVSSLSMIDRYQNPTAYQPLVFDPEKKWLAEELAEVVRPAGSQHAVLYSRSSAVAGIEADHPAYVSYDEQGRAVAWLAEKRGQPFSIRPGLPGYLQNPAPAISALADTVELRLNTATGATAIEGRFPLLRDGIGGEKAITGHLVLSTLLDQDFIDEMARSINMELRICGRHLPPTDAAAPPCPPRGVAVPELSRLTQTEVPPLWITTDSYNAAAARLSLANGEAVLLVVGLNREFLNAQIRALRVALMAGLIFATLIILSVGLLYLRTTLSHPLAYLLEGIKMLASGHFVALEWEWRRDELGRVAAAFNQMAAKLEKQQHRLRDLNTELEQRVTQRTAELLRARDIAEAANRAKSLFLANMSHELRTPLNAILGFTQLMQQDQNLTPKQHDDLLTIDRSGQHLLGLINDVLEISRIESGKITLENKAFNLRSMLVAVEEMIRVRAEKQGLSLRCELADALPGYVVGDEHRLRQILLNLLGNAVKYTPSGWVAMRVSIDDKAAATTILFEVEDSGPGIAKEDQDHIFEAFFQTTDGAAKGEGTGLGLTISHQYVSMMGGELKVESQLGQGSLFHFAIPLQAIDAAMVQEPSDERRVIGLEGDPRRYRILIAEDNDDNRRLIRRILEGVGLEVREAVDGKQALEQFEQWRPHLIWMDMRMPVMDGYEATRRIKAHPAGEETVVLALTASAFEEERSEVLAAGCDAFLRKPIRQSLIYAALEHHLGLRFRYAEEDKEEEISSLSGDELTQALKQLPAELRTQLCDQALALDAHAMAASIQMIDTTNSRLSATMHELLANYRFDEILRLLEEVPPTGDKPERLPK